MTLLRPLEPQPPTTRRFLRAADTPGNDTPGSALWLHRTAARALARLVDERVDVAGLFAHAGAEAAERWARAEILAVTDRVVLGDPADATASREALDLARTLGARRIGLTDVFIAYGFLQAVVQADLTTAAPASGQAIATHFATVLSQLALVHADALRGSAHDSESARLEALNRVLQGQVLTAGELNRIDAALRYSLHGDHRCYVIDAASGAGADAVARAAVQLVESAAPTHKLKAVVAARGYVWVAGEPGVDVILDHIVCRHNVVIGESETAPGLRGFRRVREQALMAAAHAELAGGGAPARCTYADVAPVALHCSDIDRARTFAAETLGPLFSSEPDMVGLRTTLAAALVSGSLVAASATLGVHKNTVAYRLRRCEQLLERPVMIAALDLYTALEITSVVLGEAVCDRAVRSLSAQLVKE